MHLIRLRGDTKNTDHAMDLMYSLGKFKNKEKLTHWLSNTNYSIQKDFSTFLDYEKLLTP